ncbi:MAG: hypothetical protein JXQ29_09290, partial [Planctomycetes bacterium]|nr:hypothetical protein [Planctomycetota bacterium]
MSKLSVSCPSCAKRYSVPEEYAGKKFKCKDCGATVAVPAARKPPAPEPVAEEEAPEERRQAPRPQPPARRTARPARHRPGARREAAAVEDHAPAGRRDARGGHRVAGTAAARGGSRRGAALERGAPGRPNQGLLILSGIGCLVLLVVLFVYFAFLMKDEKPVTPKKGRSVAAEDSEAARLPADFTIEEEEPGFGPASKKATEPESKPEPVEVKPPVEKPPAEKPATDEPKKKVFPPLPPAKVRKLPHYAATPEELRGEIDEAVQALLEPYGGAAGVRKKTFLVKTGKASVPALFSCMVDLDFDNEEHRLVMPMITEALYEITKATADGKDSDSNAAR